MAETSEQANWRGRSGGPSITVHLRAEELQALDLIARELYEAHPHHPPTEIAKVNPSRPAAIRWLIARWVEATGARSVAQRRRALAPPGQMAAFWRLETSWRRARYAPDPLLGPRPPAPPWRR